MKVKSASIQFNDHGTPVASAFDDVYFSNDDGAAETQYVFIDGNDLLNRFVTCTQPRFVIAETGFGTGLNCALAMTAFEQFRAQHPDHCLTDLHIVSVEKYPLSRADLSAALEHQPTSDAFKSQLVAQYPHALSGAHRLQFAHTTLDLWLGDAMTMFKQMHIPQQGLVDAWFLDGFAPSKNPDMWSQLLFDEMARLSKPAATVATFTAAGFVRRGLADAGFTMRKAKGFGRKRDMLVGSYDITIGLEGAAKSEPSPRSVAVLGAGLAGANMALSLAQRGCDVTVIDCNEVASGASGNPQGGFYPQLHAQISNASLIQAHSFIFAHRRYNALAGAKVDFEHENCGVLQLAFSEAVASRQQKMQDNQPWPESLVSHVDASQASNIANVKLDIGGLFIQHGGWISPPSLTNALLNHAGDLANVTVLTHTQVNKVTTHADGVAVDTSQGPMRFDHLVVTTGAGEHNIAPINALPFGRTRGQVESIPSRGNHNQLRTVICHKGYFTPSLNGRQALGSTYGRNDASTDYRQDEADQNLATHHKALPNSPLLEDIEHDYRGRAAVRMTLPDHQPAAGVLDDPQTHGNISILCGLGSRGLTTAPLMAEVVASALFHEPMPMTSQLIDAVHPSRFAKRAAKRGVPHSPEA